MDKDGPFPIAIYELEQPGPTAVYRVDHISFRTFVLNGPRVILITALGTAITTGWHNPRLQPYIYIQPPTDGIWDFVFVAEPPIRKPVLEVLSPIAATYVWHSRSGDLKGVRIHSATNVLQSLISSEERVVDLNLEPPFGSEVLRTM